MHPILNTLASAIGLSKEPEIDVTDSRQTKLPRRWYLIQRLQTPLHAVSEPKDIPDLVRHDYMGAAEFEWGAIPKAWKEFRRLSALAFLQMKHIEVESSGFVRKRRSVWVICQKDTHIPTLKSKLNALAAGTERTKELTHFDEYFKQEPMSEYRKQTIGWLVLDDYFPLVWFVDKKTADGVFAYLINNPEIS